MSDFDDIANRFGGGERSLKKLCAGLRDYFSPKIIGEVNDVYIKIAKIKGDDLPWHSHDNEDEMFYIIRGCLTMELENEESFVLNDGDFYIVKRGVKHRVHSEKECWNLLVEPKETRHTGDVRSKITRSIEEQM